MKSVYIFLLVILFAIGLYADVYVKCVYHYESRYHHGSLQPGYDHVYEWWIGKNKVSFLSQEYRNYENYLIEPALRVTLDKENKRVIVVNTSDSSYVYSCLVPLSSIAAGFCIPGKID